ncbi:MAG: ABC transporter permease [Chitinispirillales bacterium]|jgi:cell division transport system permease protein|nr:ABC transporter permease [Chitinispirillales bacterium]
MNMFIYFLGEMCRNLYRSKLVTSVSVITIGILLFFLICLSLLMFNIRIWVNDNENQPQMSVYLDINLSQEQENSLAQDIIYIVNAQKINFISRDESYNIFRSLYGSEMLSAVDENPFPAVLEFRFSNDYPKDKIDLISKEIEKFDGVESLVYSNEWQKKLENFRLLISRGIIIFSIVMISVVFFTIMNTIKLTVYARKDMIKNMLYIGASGWYIRTPFVLEGIAQGTLGALIALAAVVPIKILAVNLNFYWGNMQFMAAIVLFGAILGFLGSFFAVRKFINIVPKVN